jgi:hypothetical protein
MLVGILTIIVGAFAGSDRVCREYAAHYSPIGRFPHRRGRYVHMAAVMQGQTIL